MEEWIVHSVDIVLGTILNSKVFELLYLLVNPEYHLASGWVEMDLERRVYFDYFKS